MKKWKTYMPDQIIATAGVEILDIKSFGRNQDTTVYIVRYLCCNATGDITHAAIRKRAYLKRKKCSNCRRPSRGNRLMDKHKQEIIPPEWPVPKMLERLPKPRSEE